MNSRFFLERDLERIRQAVKAAERQTSGEIVPVIARKSVPYAWLVGSLGLMGLIGGSVCGIWVAYHWPFAAELKMIFALQALGLTFGALVGALPLTVRMVLGKARLRAEVLAGAQLAFVQEGLFQTQERTGILIYVSLRERQVVILADQGINAKVGPQYWDSAVKKITDGIRTGTAGDAMAEVIAGLGHKLAEHFPRKHGDKNELADDVRLR